MPTGRTRVVYTGRVQGVGFRATTADLARRFPVRGVVRNRADGRVEVVVEGDAAEVQAFLDAVRTELAANIRAIDAEPVVDTSDSLEGFKIAH